jgi:hypothetical protein
MSNYCKWCIHYFEKHRIDYEDGEEYVICIDTCKKYQDKKIDEYDENDCYEEEEKK